MNEQKKKKAGKSAAKLGLVEQFRMEDKEHVLLT